MSAATTPPEAGLTPALIDQVMSLPAADRDRLADLIRERQADIEASRAEIARRIEAVENGTMPTYAPEDVFERVRQALAEARKT